MYLYVYVYVASGADGSPLSYGETSKPTHSLTPPHHQKHANKQVNDAIHALHGGDCLRAVVSYAN